LHTGITRTDNVIPFPPQLRMVPIQPPHALPPKQTFALIEHDGRIYDLAAPARHLSAGELLKINDAVPRSAQEMWDEVVRRWPSLASEIVASVQPIS
jgi:hypothetical protein